MVSNSLIKKETSSNEFYTLLPNVRLWKDAKHSHFWIKDNELYESYNTIRGLRYRHRLSLNGLPNTDNCLEDMILYIEMEYLN